MSVLLCFISTDAEGISGSVASEARPWQDDGDVEPRSFSSVCVYSMYISSMCVCACASSSGTRCSYALPVPRLFLPRLAYHVEHQDNRIRRGVGVRAGGSQGRRELQAAADNELVTEKHVHAVHSSVLIWLDSFPPSDSAFISGS